MDEKLRMELDNLGSDLHSTNHVLMQTLGSSLALDTGLQVIYRSWGLPAEDVMALLKSELDAGAREIRSRGARAATVQQFNLVAASLMNSLQAAAKDKRGS